MAGPHRTAARNTVWLIRADDDTNADDARQLLDMLGLIGDQPRYCPRHDAFHVDTTDEPATNPRAADAALATLIGDLNSNKPGAGRTARLPPPNGKHCPPGLRRLFEEPQPPTEQPELRQPPAPPVRPKPRAKAKPKPPAKNQADTGKPHHRGNGRPRPPCGTPGGRSSHRYHGEPVCEACKAARRAADAKWKRDNYRTRPTTPPLPCGTEAAYRRHLREGLTNSQIDEACRQARRDAETVRRRNRRQAAIEAGTAQQHGRRPARCGTPSGYKRHKKQGTDVCDACRKAKCAQNRKYDKDRQDRERAAREAQQQAAQAA
jgi:hypothetical protein